MRERLSLGNFMEQRRNLSRAKRIVVKVGTSSLTDERSKLDSRKVGKLVGEVMELRKNGKEVLLVTSGAIGAGMEHLKLERRPGEMPFLQATAAVGQGLLMQIYGEYFNRYNQPIAQMLLTREDFMDPNRYKNFRNTLATLLKWNVIPIVNENDSVEVEEIRLGDNDILSAFVAKGAQADLLIMLLDVNGLYTGDPNKNKQVKLVKTVEKVTPEIEKLAGKASPRGFGGMATKVQAAKTASEDGITVVLVNSEEKDLLKRVLAGEEIGTIFLPKV
jgi:glutamate 5-kinase